MTELPVGKAIRGPVSARINIDGRERLPMMDRDAIVVSSAGQTLSQPLLNAGAANSVCR
jgi:hypothetical protein